MELYCNPVIAITLIFTFAMLHLLCFLLCVLYSFILYTIRYDAVDLHAFKS